MEKVKVDKKTFDALEKWKEKKVYPFETAMKLKAKNRPFISNDFLPLNNLDIEELAKCLINDYELEETPEEELARYYNMESENIMDDVFNSGIRCALNTLGIQIKGINS